eukprot:COSAG05_NODE_108_length_18693_cov_7.956709_7_plen_289_part_00
MVEACPLLAVVLQQRVAPRLVAVSNPGTAVQHDLHRVASRDRLDAPGHPRRDGGTAPHRVHDTAHVLGQGAQHHRLARRIKQRERTRLVPAPARPRLGAGRWVMARVSAGFDTGCWPRIPRGGGPEVASHVVVVEDLIRGVLARSLGDSACAVARGEAHPAQRGHQGGVGAVVHPAQVGSIAHRRLFARRVSGNFGRRAHGAVAQLQAHLDANILNHLLLQELPLLLFRPALAWHEFQIAGSRRRRRGRCRQRCVFKLATVGVPAHAPAEAEVAKRRRGRPKAEGGPP